MSLTLPGGSGQGFAPTGDDGLTPSGEGTLLFTYTRNKQALAALTLQVEWSDTLATGDWYTNGVTEDVLSDDGSLQHVQATVPMGSAGHRFVHLKVTKP